jgi:WhiB family redox-sensing transcriptional regulator
MSDWRASAACAGRDPRLWFATPSLDPVAAGVAARICRCCPVRADCAGEALRLLRRDGALYGTWAGVALNGPTSSIARLVATAGGSVPLTVTTGW